MLNIYHSIKYDLLIKNFTEHLLETWTVPFNPPLIIFADSKIEQWFKLNVISKNKDVPVLMNLHTESLEHYLFKLLIKGIQKSQNDYKKLSPELLKSIILNKLEKDKYYQTLSPKIESYIQNSDESINQNNLYSIAKNISNMFTQYMDSRNDHFEKGIHEKWIHDESFFTNNDEENWQRKLYTDLFSSNEYSVKNETASFTTNYVTLAQLVSINKESNNQKLNLNPENNNIFLWGFNSIGQFYHTLLQEISKKTNLHVYLQSNGISTSESENPLLKQWNKVGSENFDLWKTENANFIQIEDDNSEPISLLQEIQTQILSNKNQNDAFKKYFEKKDDSFTVTGAPSLLKEVEVLHSSICNVIKKNKDNNKVVTYSDFIVLAPNIDDYKVAIMQIFDQINPKSSQDFPYIPYVFADFTGEKSALAQALNLFVSILKEGVLYRTTLFKILRNPLIKSTKGYSEEELSAWSSWVANLNAFRNSKTRENEWQDVKKRLLISTLTEKSFAIGDETYKSYSDMNSQSTETLFKFIDALDVLETWQEKFSLKKKDSLELEDIKSIKDFLAYWFTPSSEKKDFFVNEKIVYASVKKEIAQQEHLFQFGYEKINANGFFSSLIASAREAKGACTNLFVGGITFTNFTYNRTIPGKYVYILGLDSKVFPGIDSKLNIDLRTTCAPKIGDAASSDRNKNTFLCQLMATKEKLAISFVNKDLKKDEDFFHSSVVDEIMNCIGAESKNFIKTISIDEIRNWEDLYTCRGIRNKKNFKNVTSESENNSGDFNKYPQTTEYPQRVSLSDMKKFLENPFIFFAKQVLNSNEGKEEENESIEPIKLDDLSKHIILSDIIIDVISNPEKKVQEKIEELKLEHAIPAGFFGNVVQNELCNVVNDIVNNFAKKKESLDNPKFTFNESVKLKISYEDNGQNRDFEVTGNLCGYYFDGKILHVVDFVYSKEIKTKHRLKLYLSALATIEQKKFTPKEVQLHLLKDDNEEKFSFFVEKDPILLLQNIYKRMYVEPFKKMILINKLEKKSIKTDYGSLNEFVKALKNDYSWEYFSKKNFFDPYKDFWNASDFDKNEINTVYKKAVDEWLELVPGLM